MQLKAPGQASLSSFLLAYRVVEKGKEVKQDGGEGKEGKEVFQMVDALNMKNTRGSRHLAKWRKRDEPRLSVGHFT